MQPLVTSLAPWQIALVLAFYAACVWVMIKLANEIAKDGLTNGVD